MRIVDFTTIALKDLKGQPVRSGLTLVALVISTVILVIMAAISIGGQQTIANQFGSDAALTTIAVTPNQSDGSLSPYGNVQQVNSGATKLDDAAVAKLAALPHVKSSSPRAHIWEFNNFTVAGSDKQFVAQAEGVTSDAALPLVAGTSFASNDAKNVVIIGRAYAKELGLSETPEQLVGKNIQIVTQKGYRGDEATIPSATASERDTEAFNQTTTTLQATIIGVTESGPDQNSLFIPLGWARDIRAAKYNEGNGSVKTIDQIANDGYATIQIKADAVANVKSVSEQIGQLGYGQVSTLSQIERLQQFSTTMWLILGAVAVIAVVAAALGVVNTMLMSVSEQSHTIGVWRASGARKGFIVRLFLVEAGLLGLIGGLIGVGVGALVSQFVNSYVNTLLKDQNLAIVDIATIPIWLAVGTVALTSLFGILAGLYPAYRAARLDPSKTLSSGQ